MYALYIYFLSSVKNPNQPNIQRGIAYLPIFSSLVGSISIFTKTCCQLRYSGSLAVGDFQSWTKVHQFTSRGPLDHSDSCGVKQATLSTSTSEAILFC